MYFHIDESGNTGNNLFDPNQPQLSYGVLSSTTNVDALGEPIYRRLLKELKVDSLHANELGIGGITRIAPQLIRLQKKMRFDFDYYFIHKPSYALVIFFDAVFDAGLNEAVKWGLYWTPLRFPMILKLSVLFDDDLLKEAWTLCIHKKIQTQEKRVVALLQEVLNRAESSELDARSKELIGDSLRFGIKNPLSLDFGVNDQKLLSPNSVCFQFVMSSIAMRLNQKGKKDAASIVVDRQTQFNQSQIGTHYNFKRIEEGLKASSAEDRRWYLSHPLFTDFDEDYLLRKGAPSTPLTILPSDESIGLQIVDLYLWIANRHMSGGRLSPELESLVRRFVRRSTIDGISMDALVNRWENFERQLPAFEDLTDEQIELGKRSVDWHREKVRGLNLQP